MSAVTRRACLAALGLLVVAGLGRAASSTRDTFPHARHERLFPVCESCHAGVLGGDARSAYPDASACARCHDDVRRPRVQWRGAPVRASNLRFSHERHLARLADRSEPAGADGNGTDRADGAAAGPGACQACHGEDGATGRMAVGRAAPERCIACHEHRAPAHLALPDCTQCHVPLGAAAGIAPGHIARFPRPDWHMAADFISAHASRAASADASCAVCHARETCERCHANADRLPEVRELSRDERVATLEAGRVPAYPSPATHAARDWHSRHGSAARGGLDGCANCHTRPSCTRCHGSGEGDAVTAIARLPQPVRGGATGVDPSLITRSVHGADVQASHGRLAASGSLDCAQCHTRSQCASCHAAGDSKAFHPTNFLERHAVDVFTARSDCQTCHSTETFCRSCHAQAGFAARGMKSSFHDGQPNWVLSHGQAARRGLEACVSCHRQGDCVQCHSAAGGWGVNPHGPGFTGRGASRSAASCRLCHLAAPGRGN